MNRVGIQLKPDHPAFQRFDSNFAQYHGQQYLPEPNRFKALQAFARAYGFSDRHAEDLEKQGMFELTRSPDGTWWAGFRSDMTPDEAAQALRTMGMLGL